MEAQPPSPIEDPSTIILQDPAGDRRRAEHEHELVHDHATEVTHAWEHFWENARFFGGMFLPVILLTVIAFNTNFGAWNGVVTWLLAALRSACIAYFLSTLFKNFSFVFRTLFFTIVFLIGMIFLSLWDSEVQPGVIGDPIYDYAHPESMRQ